MKKRSEFHTRGEVKITYSMMFWLFMIGSVIGFILEGLWHILKHGMWESHSATVWGPFCIVYGLGAMALFLASAKMNDKTLLRQFIICGCVGSAVEWVTAVFQEAAFGSSSWDYSNQTFQLGGKISLLMTILWGLLGITFVKFVFPLLAKVLPMARGMVWSIACVVLSAFMAVDLVITGLAVARWSERIEMTPPSGDVDAYLDMVYDDARMEKTFPNMVFASGE